MSGRITLESLRLGRVVDLDGEFSDDLTACTFCDVEDMIRECIDTIRVNVETARMFGASPSKYLRSFLVGELPDDVRYAIAYGHFAAGERAVRISREAAQRFVSEAHKFAETYISANAPWLGDVDAIEDDA